MRPWQLLPALLLVAAACTLPPAGSDAAQPTEADAGAGAAPALLPSLQATTLGDSVQFVLQVTNTTAEPVEVRFSSGQSFDFLVLRGERPIWQWGAELGFTQALRSRTLDAGETATYQAAWTPPPGVSGELTLVGRLTSSSHPLEQRIRFEVP